MFVHYSKTKAEFIAAGLASTYSNHIVFIKGDANGNGSCIYTHGNYFANFAELIEAVNFVKGVKVGDSQYNAAAGGGYIPFASGDNSTVALNVDNGTITVGLTDTFVNKVNNTSTDLGSKSDAANSGGSAFARIANLAQLVSDLTGGSVDSIEGQISKAIANLRAEIAGNLSDTTDAKTLEAINDELNDIYTKITPLNSDYTSIAEQVDGLETAVAGLGVTVEKQTSAENGYAATYVIKQGAAQVGEKINIPKDQFLKSATLVKGNWSSDTFTESAAGTGKAIKLEVFTEAGDSDVKVDTLYINVTDLVDVYTAKANAGLDGVQVAISDTNVISATIVDGTVTNTKLMNGAVSEDKLGAASVTTNKIKDAAVTFEKLDADVKKQLTYVLDYDDPDSVIPHTTYEALADSSLSASAVIKKATGSERIFLPAIVDKTNSSSLIVKAVYGNVVYVMTINSSAIASGNLHQFSASTETYLTAANINIVGNKFEATTVAGALDELHDMWAWEEL